MERWKRRAVNMVFSLIFGGDGPPPVAFRPQKTSIGEPELRYLRRSSPERHGISSRRLCDMLSRLEAEQRAHVHSLMVIAGGEVICECSAEGYRTDCWHMSNSMSKTVVGMIIGMLIDDGLIRLEGRLCDYLPEYPYRDRKFAQITIHHLLSMTAGVEFAEVGAVTEESWTECFFASTVKFQPGTRFFYNSMNTYILARVAERCSGVRFGELAERRFFGPMGIKSYHWEIGPEGCEKGGWGLYMSPESWARVGCMLLYGGFFGGRRILSEKWIGKMTSFKAETPLSCGDFNYGYHLWCQRRGDELLLSGMLGQSVWICPKNDLIVVMSGGNNELFGASPALEIVRSTLGGRINDRLNSSDSLRLRRREAEFFLSRRWIRFERPSLIQRIGRKICGREDVHRELVGEYVFPPGSQSLIPIVLRAMQNGLGGELEKLGIAFDGGGLRIKFRESNEEYTVYAGIYRYEKNIISYRGEKYRLMAAAGQDSEGRGLLLELIFSETASVRRVKMRREENKIILELSECPSERLIEYLLTDFSAQSPVFSVAMDMLKRRFGERAVEDMIRRSFNPTIVGVDVSSAGVDEALSGLCQVSESRGIRLARSLVGRIFGEGEK